MRNERLPPKNEALQYTLLISIKPLSLTEIYNPKYGDIVLNAATDHFSAANIIGIFRKNFTSSYSQIEAVRQKKDEQIDQFLATNSKLIEEIQRRGERVDRLIDKLMEDN
jgi:galactokinase/mevalonate kinase-like predicted kinase